MKNFNNMYEKIKPWLGQKVIVTLCLLIFGIVSIQAQTVEGQIKDEQNDRRD